MSEVSILGILITIFIVLNIVSTVIIVSACIVSGRASRSLEPGLEAKMVSQRELAIAISKLRVISPQLAATNQAPSHSLFFTTAEQTEVDVYPISHSVAETAVVS